MVGHAASGGEIGVLSLRLCIPFWQLRCFPSRQNLAALELDRMHESSQLSNRPPARWRLWQAMVSLLSASDSRSAVCAFSGSSRSSCQALLAARLPGQRAGTGQKVPLDCRPCFLICLPGGTA